MGIDLSSINSSISSLINRFSTNNQANSSDSADVKSQIRQYANSIVTNRKNLSNYMESKDNNTFGTLSDDSVQNKLLSAVSKMKSTNGMSSIEKYKYMMEQAQNSDKVDITEPDAEKLLSKSEKIIQKALNQGISVTDTVALSRALTAKQIAMSRLDMLG